MDETLIGPLAILLLVAGLIFVRAFWTRRTGGGQRRRGSIEPAQVPQEHPTAPARPAAAKPYDADDHEAFADMIVYNAYGPGRLSDDIIAALRACGPGWHRLEQLGQQLPERHASDDHRNALWVLVQEGQIQARPDRSWPREGSSQEFSLP